jgi:hypothetical protein
MPLSPLAAELPIAGAQALLGGFQYLNAINQAKKNIRPTYSIDPSYQYNVDILKNTMGLPQSALDLYYKNIGQNTNQGINGILSSGGNANQIASLVNGQNQNYENIAVQDALQRKQDINGILGAQTALAEQKDKAWQLNFFDPYKDRAQAISAEKTAGLNNIFGGLNSVSGAFANDATSKLADSITTPNSGVNIHQIMQFLKDSQSPRYGAANLPPSPYPKATDNPYNPYNETQMPNSQQYPYSLSSPNIHAILSYILSQH